MNYQTNDLLDHTIVITTYHTHKMYILNIHMHNNKTIRVINLYPTLYGQLSQRAD